MYVCMYVCMYDAHAFLLIPSLRLDIVTLYTRSWMKGKQTDGCTEAPMHPTRIIKSDYEVDLSANVAMFLRCTGSSHDCLLHFF